MLIIQQQDYFTVFFIATKCMYMDRWDRADGDKFNVEIEKKKTLGAICGGSMERNIVDHVPRENSKWVRHNYGKLVARVFIHLRFPYSPWSPPGRQLFLWSRTGKGGRRSREERSVQLRQQACLLAERQWQNAVESLLEQLIINHLFEGPAVEIRGK